MESVSSTDAREAELVGQAAVRYALDGHNEELVTLIREPGDGYFCTTGTAPLKDVAGQVRAMPPEYLDVENFFVTDEFIKLCEASHRRSAAAHGKSWLRQDSRPQPLDGAQARITSITCCLASGPAPLGTMIGRSMPASR